MLKIYKDCNHRRIYLFFHITCVAASHDILLVTKYSILGSSQINVIMMCYTNKMKILYFTFTINKEKVSVRFFLRNKYFINLFWNIYGNFTDSHWNGYKFNFKFRPMFGSHGHLAVLCHSASVLLKTCLRAYYIIICCRAFGSGTVTTSFNGLHRQLCSTLNCC